MESIDGELKKALVLQTSFVVVRPDLTQLLLSSYIDDIRTSSCYACVKLLSKSTPQVYDSTELVKN